MRTLKKYLEKILNGYVGHFTVDIDSLLTSLLKDEYTTDKYRIWVHQGNRTKNIIKISLISRKRLHEKQCDLGTIEYKKVKDKEFGDYHYASFNITIFDDIINEDFNSFANKMVETWDIEDKNIEEGFKRERQEFLSIYKLIMKEFNCTFEEADHKLGRIHCLWKSDKDAIKEELEKERI